MHYIFYFMLIDLHNGFYVDCHQYKKGVFLRFAIFEKVISKKLCQVFSDL